jgi:hypothetical protein
MKESLNLTKLFGVQYTVPKAVEFQRSKSWPRKSLLTVLVDMKASKE